MRGSSQKFGVVCELPDSAISRFCATSRCSRPAWIAFVRSTFTLIAGSSPGCWMRASTSPRTPRSFASSAFATARFWSSLLPTIWMSIGAGSPKLRIWLTMSAGRNANVTPGNACASTLRSFATYAAVDA